MPYKKVTYPQRCSVYRWPDDPRNPATPPTSFVDVRWMWYPKFGVGESLSFPGPSSAIVIIAFPLAEPLLDGPRSALGYGDYLIPQIPISRVWQLLLSAPHALGYPNQTMLGIVTDLATYPAGPP